MNDSFLDGFREMLACMARDLAGWIALLVCRHAWQTIFEDGPRVVQWDPKWQEVRSTVYDMCYGGTYWTPGNAWAPASLVAEYESPEGHQA